MSTEETAAVHLSIGEVLSFLQEEFPDVTISKIRFLESQGLIQPDRTASGYRKFYESDIERLQWILRQQRDHFLPLKVIRKMLDEGVDRFDPGGGEQPTLWTPTDDDDADAFREPEPATVGAPPARSAAHPAVASSTAAHPAVASSTAGPARAARAQEPRRVTAPAPASEPDDGAATGRPTSGRGDAATAVPGVPPPAAAATTDAGTDPTDSAGPAGGGSEDPGPTERPALETPADVVAALQEDPRTRRKRGGSGGSGGTGGGSGRTGAPRTPRPPTDPSTEVTAAELCAATGIDEGLLAGLEQYGLVEAQHRGGEAVYGADAVDVARLAARYASLGVEPRHLRMYLVSAEREAGFVEQLAVPLLKQRNPQARTQAGDLAAELRSMGAELHATLLRRELGPDLGA